MSADGPREARAPDPAARFTGGDFAAELRTGLARLFRQHTSLAITLTYLFLTVIGAAYEFAVLINFRINVFQFADATDFLLAAVRQPLTAVFAIAPIGVVLLIEAIDRALRRKSPRYRHFSERSDRLGGPRGRTSYRIGYGILIGLYFTAATLRLGNVVADRLREGRGRQVRVELVGPGLGGGTRVQGTLLGTTSRFVFVYAPAESISHVIPRESIVEMGMDRRGRSAGGVRP